MKRTNQTSNKPLAKVSRIFLSAVLLAGLAMSTLTVTGKSDDTSSLVKKDEKNAAAISLPSVKMIRKADNEVIRNMNESMKVQKLYMPVSDMINADSEINMNFSDENKNIIKMNNSSVVNKADEDMNTLFVKENTRINIPVFTTNADDEINSSFKSETSLNIAVINKSLLIKADDDMVKNFKSDNNKSISLPLAELVNQSDAEMTVTGKDKK
ncbi:MAG: hypothetical protein SFU87_17015 [Chitinophagaceae bacterium]|nr:hypothetical protein [Chitinophagaceae bacterium]